MSARWFKLHQRINSPDLVPGSDISDMLQLQSKSNYPGLMPGSDIPQMLEITIENQWSGFGPRVTYLPGVVNDTRNTWSSFGARVGYLPTALNYTRKTVIRLLCQGRVPPRCCKLQQQINCWFKYYLIQYPWLQIKHNSFNFSPSISSFLGLTLSIMLSCCHNKSIG